jgi:hypothetical protein
MKTYSFFASIMLLIFATLISGCNKNEEVVTILPARCTVNATFEDFTGLDGCGFLLVMQSGQFEQVLEPINLADFELTPTEGLEVCIDFVDATDAASICMAGRLIELYTMIPVGGE